jgi:hypothetical protein
MRPKCIDFFVGEVAPLAGWQIAKQDRSLAHTDKPQYLIAKQLGHLTDLAFAALVQHHPYPYAILASLQHVDPSRCGRHAFQQHAGAPFAQRIRGGRLVEQRAVFLLDLVARVGQALG